MSPNDLSLTSSLNSVSLSASLLLQKRQHPGLGREWEPEGLQSESSACTAWVLRTAQCCDFSINKKGPAHSPHGLLGPNLYPTESHILSLPCFITPLFMAGEVFFFSLKNIFITGKANSRLHTSGKSRTGALP